KLLVLNGSPKKDGTVATLLRAVVEGAAPKHEVEWIDLYDLTMQPCLGCMKCRPDGECCLPEDDAHRVGRKIREADGLIVGTPTYWGNMSSQLKTLFDRIVPAIISQQPNGIPVPRHRGKHAVIATACTTPWPANFLFHESRGAVRAVREVLSWGGYRIQGVVVQPGTKERDGASKRVIDWAKRVGQRL
ncbi:MAG: flavodoxin family protein, partial [Bryobacteraceae bacterium]